MTTETIQIKKQAIIDKFDLEKDSLGALVSELSKLIDQIADSVEADKQYLKNLQSMINFAIEEKLITHDESCEIIVERPDIGAFDDRLKKLYLEKAIAKKYTRTIDWSLCHKCFHFTVGEKTCPCGKASLKAVVLSEFEHSSYIRPYRIWIQVKRAE